MENKAVETAFIVFLNTDGTFRVDMKLEGDLPEVTRTATQYDVLNISQQIVKEIESQDLTNRILAGMIQIMSAAQEQSPADKVKEKLKERGINPDTEQSPVN